VVGNAGLDGVVDPVANCDAGREEELEAGPKLAAYLFRCHFGGKHGDKDRGAACAKATDHTTSIEEPY
jgi:hypothetical protein